MIIMSRVLRLCFVFCSLLHIIQVCVAPGWHYPVSLYIYYCDVRMVAEICHTRLKSNNYDRAQELIRLQAVSIRYRMRSNIIIYCYFVSRLTVEIRTQFSLPAFAMCVRSPLGENCVRIFTVTSTPKNCVAVSFLHSSDIITELKS